VSARMAHRRERGFSLVEVLVSVIVIAIGLLGIAKIQGLAFSSMGVASMRSLAAIEASSLAASMHANRAYWGQGGVAVVPITVTGTAISDPTLATPADCTTATKPNPPNCTLAQLAAYDLQTWAGVVSGVPPLLPGAQTTIQCSNIVGAPVSCTVTITWVENTVGINQQGANTTATLPSLATQQSYVLTVEP
jgi:type IV pilus assembly protein PilV